jgi:hypothetical protein
MSGNRNADVQIGGNIGQNSHHRKLGNAQSQRAER